MREGVHIGSGTACGCAIWPGTGDAGKLGERVVCRLCRGRETSWQGESEEKKTSEGAHLESPFGFVGKLS